MVTDVPLEGEEDVNVNSSTTEEGEEGNDDGGSDAKDTKTVPYNRFAQKVKENARLTKMSQDMLAEVRELKSMIKASKQVDYDSMTPQEMAKHIREEVQNEHKLEQMQEAQKVQEAEQFIETFFENLEEEGHKFDANEVMKLAIEDFDNDLPKAWKAYQREQKAKSEVAAEKAKNKAKEGESVAGKKGDDVKAPKTPNKSWNDVYESGFKYIKAK